MTIQEQIAFLDPFITEHKRDKMETVLANRTDKIRVVLEDIFQPHNASAVMRSCECFGIQYLHVIENEHRYRPNTDVARGAGNWITLTRHNRSKDGQHPTRSCLNALRANGYRIVTTAPGSDSCPIAELPLDEPVALCFGTEWEGASEILMSCADYKVHIPMYGFTQSYNVSVSVALCLYELTKRLRSMGTDPGLPNSVKEELRLAWRKQAVRLSDKILDAAAKRTSAFNAIP